MSTDREVFDEKGGGGGGSIFKIINFVFRMGKGKNKLSEILLVFTKLQVLEENVNLKRKNSLTKDNCKVTSN